jgi:hypothetical protein
MLYPAVIVICVLEMINAWTAHAKEHRSRVLNVRVVMDIDVRSILVSV